MPLTEPSIAAILPFLRTLSALMDPSAAFRRFHASAPSALVAHQRMALRACVRFAVTDEFAARGPCQGRLVLHCPRSRRSRIDMLERQGFDHDVSNHARDSAIYRKKPIDAQGPGL